MNEEMIRRDVQIAVAAAFQYLRQPPGRGMLVDDAPEFEHTGQLMTASQLYARGLRYIGRANMNFDTLHNVAPVILPPL